MMIESIDEERYLFYDISYIYLCTRIDANTAANALQGKPVILFLKTQEEGRLYICLLIHCSFQP